MKDYLAHVISKKLKVLGLGELVRQMSIRCGGTRHRKGKDIAV